MDELSNLPQILFSMLGKSSEHLPLQSKLANKFTLIRSVSHTIADHPGGAARFLSGYVPKNISKMTSDYPTFDTIAGELRGETASSSVPRFISNQTALKGGGPAYLGPTAQPFVFDSAPHLDRQYSAFGKVIKGMEFVDMIKKGDPNSGSVTNPDKIISLRSK